MSGAFMDRARYFAALFLLMTPGAFLYWFSIHPFIGFWRKLPPTITLGIHFLMMGAVAAILLLFRRTLLAVDFGGQPVLEATGVLLMAASLVLKAHVSRLLTKRILMGVAELAPEQTKTPLLTSGPFARVRNPRYLQVLMAHSPALCSPTTWQGMCCSRSLWCSCASSSGWKRRNCRIVSARSMWTTAPVCRD